MSSPIRTAPLETIGRYQVLGHLATGGMAEVLLGKLLGPSGFQRAVVIKRILPHLAREPSFVRMFLDEARIVASIRHSNVVQVHELGQEGEQLYLVMEYLEGESADGLLRRLTSRRERLDWGLCAHIVAEACAGLHAAHELTDEDGNKKNLVHRDVSPQNIFLTYAGEVKVLDFGIAKTTDQSRTEAGYMKGKYAYMAPEQIRGEPLDRRSDIFAMGIVLYELSTGRRLFSRKSELMVMKAICEEAIVPPSRVIRGYPPWLEQIVMRALSRRREDRFESAAEMRRFVLAAIRLLGLTETRDELLAAELKRLFADRIAEKLEMLRRVRSGVDLTHVPSADVATSIEVPVAIDVPIEAVEEPVADTPLSVEVPGTGAFRTGGRRRQWLLAAAGSFAVTALAVLWLARPGGTSDETTAPARPVPLAKPAAMPLRGLSEVAAPPIVSPAGTTPVAAQVTVEVQTEPAGATVLVDGEERGQTPVELRLTRSEQPVSVTLRLAGHEQRVESVRPDVAQRLRFDLQRAVTRPAHPVKATPRPVSPPHPTKTPPQQGTGFFRYD